jgi:ribosomal protein S18 acetylase RimI-like enzyme
VGAATIRGYEQRDRDACRALWRELTQWHRDIYDDQSLHADRDAGDFFDEHLDHVGAERIWVAELDGAVAGFAGLIVEGRRGELEPLVVATGVRGRGVGRALTERVIAAARAAGLRRLDVQPAARNVGAIRFFHDAGFDTLGQLELMLYLEEPKDWPVQERLAERDFRA